MADDTLGTARLSIVVDTSNFDAAINQARRGVTGMSQEAQAAYNQLTAAQRKQVDSLIRQSDLIGKTRQEQLLYNAALRGVPTSILDELKTKLAATGDAAVASEGKIRRVAVATKELNQYGISAGQQAAALRGVPAQLTDILVGLQGGQSPLTILFQQGGQLRDMFGGLVPAAKALGGAVLSLATPFTLAAGAVGALALAYSQGAKEQEEFRKTLILTGSASGETASSLAELARSASQGGGFTQSKAAEVLNGFVSSGKIAQSALKDVTTAAIELEQVAGQKIENTAAVFAKLGDEPAKASAELNQQYHYLTASVYEQIQALEAQGSKEEAAALAQSTYAKAVQQRISEVRGSAGLLESSWNSVALAAKKAWDSMLDIGRTGDPLDEAIAKLQQNITNVEARRGTTGLNDAGEKRLAAAKEQLALMQGQLQTRQNIARANQLDAEAQANAISAGQEVLKQQEKGLSNDEKRNKALDDYHKQLDAIRRANPTSDLLKPANVAAGEQAIRDQFKDPKAPAAKAYTDDAATKLLQQYRDAEASLTAQLDSQQKIGSWEQKRVEFEQQIADLKGKAILTADQKSILANQDALKAQLDKNVALEKEQKTKEANLRLTALEQSLQATMLADQQKYGDQEAAFGLGSQAQQRLTEQTGIYRDYQRQLTQITNNRTTGKIGDDEYQQQTAALRDSLDARLALQQDHFAQLDVLQSDWTKGATSALADYSDQAKNVAASTKSAFSDAFKGAEDAIVEFVQTGKLSVTDLANSVIADLIRISVRSSVTGPISQALGQGIAGLFGSGSSAPTAAQLSASTQGVNAGLPLSFDGGGYTGAGGKYEPAGIVHRGEVVWSQDDIARAGGVAAVEAMRRGFRGYDDGGIVGGASMPSNYLATKKGADAPQIQINIVNQSSNSDMDAKQGKVMFDGEKYVTDIILKDRLKNGPISRSFGGGR